MLRVNGCFLNNNAHAHELFTKMILRIFVSLRAFTVYMKNSLWFEISLWSNWTHVNPNNEVTLHRSKILPQSEILNRFELTSVLM